MSKPLAHSRPTFTDTADERRHLKIRLAATFRLFGRLGFGEGVAGHVTARDPEFPDRFWVNPFAVDFRQITAGDLLCVAHDGEIVHGEVAVNQAAFAIHAAVHAARPDVVAAAHTHSVHGRALSCTGQLLEPLSQDACAFYDDHVRFDDYTGVVLDPAEGRRIADALGGSKAAILANHGLLTVGRSVDEAAWWFITMERSCQVQLLAKAATGGTPLPIPDDVARLTASQVGSEVAGWLSYQPLFSWILREEPDLVDGADG